MIKILEEISASSRLNNEDLVLTTKEFVLVLDGSTNLGMYNDRPDAAWYVQKFARSFERNFDPKDLKKSVLSALQLLRAQYISKTGCDPVLENAVPSASFSLIYQDGELLKVALLGDCSAVIYRKSGTPDLLYQDGVNVLDERVLFQMQQISMRDGISLAQTMAYSQIQELLRYHRSLMNTENGYWIMSCSEEAIEHMEIKEIPLDDVSGAVLFTDGFEMAREYFLQGMPTISLKTLYDKIYDEEERDPEFMKYPRFKLHDDASCVLLKTIK